MTDHVMNKNHTIDWEGVRLSAKESNWKKRGVKEAGLLSKYKLPIASTHQDNPPKGKLWKKLTV